MSVATSMMTEMMDAAMDDILQSKNINPSEIDRVKYGENGKILGIETDTEKLSLLKTAFTAKLAEKLKQNGDIIKISVPIGTLIGNEYTLGRGPRISFELQYSYTVNSEVTATFSEAGINNTVHSVELEVTNNLFIIIPWGHTSKSINTKYIVAETVIVGEVPDAFTNVYGASDEITDDIINFGAEVE